MSISAEIPLSPSPQENFFENSTCRQGEKPEIDTAPMKKPKAGANCPSPPQLAPSVPVGRNGKIDSPTIRKIAKKWIKERVPTIATSVELGLPELDRNGIWKVALLASDGRQLGELGISSAGAIASHTQCKLILSRATSIGSADTKPKKSKTSVSKKFIPTPIPNKVILGDAVSVLEDFPLDSVQLVVTSPPYYNARPEYSEYLDYQEYLDFLRKIATRTAAILSEGRFFVINVSPVLLRRASRNESSRRLAIPFDVHKVMESAGFEFIDDIIWVKPDGAGWVSNRGRRFSADRQPLQYKPVPVTEYILVYRKKTDKLIDWNIRAHHDQGAVARSKILGDYDVTNVWKIAPSHSKLHPATYPDELVRRIIRDYSFEGDLVLDPFGGSGTTGRVALKMNRRFLLIEKNPTYYHDMETSLSRLAATDFPGIRIDFEQTERTQDKEEL